MIGRSDYILPFKGIPLPVLPEWVESISPDLLKQTAHQTGVDFLECFCESVVQQEVTYHNGKWTIHPYNHLGGMSFRSFQNDNIQSYALHNFIPDTSLSELSLIQKLFGKSPGRWNRTNAEETNHETDITPVRLIMQEIHDTAWSRHWAIEEVFVKWNHRNSFRRVINSEGTQTSELFRDGSLIVGMTLICGEGTFVGDSEYAYYADDQFPTLEQARKIANDAVDKALNRQKARFFPSDEYPVILDAGQCGVVLHEMFSHALEADQVLGRLSYLSGMVGEKVAPAFFNFADDGTVPTQRGYAKYDDEGTPVQKSELIVKGVLKGFLHDRRTAKMMNVPLTGSSRRENYTVLPMPRSRHLVVSAGPSDPNELIRSVDKGLFVNSVRFGQTNPNAGLWVVTAENVWWIRQGRIQRPLGSVLLMGQITDSMGAIEAVANDSTNAQEKNSYCIKNKQSVPIGATHPTMKIRAFASGIRKTKPPNGDNHDRRKKKTGNL